MNTYKSLFYISINTIFYIFCFSNSKLVFRIIRSPIFNFFPQFKQHHLILLSNDAIAKDRDFYLIDFTPVNQTLHKRTLSLLSGKNVPAEVRVRYLNNLTTTTNNDDEIISLWDKSLVNTQITGLIYESMEDQEIKNITEKLLAWKLDKNQTMNLYTRNCQHFSGFAKKVVFTHLHQDELKQDR
jgi:hypothetical protein